MRLDCRLARFGGVELPQWLLSDPEQLSRTYRTASGGDIDLALDASRLKGPPITADVVVGPWRLHQALRQIAANGDKVTSIAVLFAGRYNYGPDVLGIMFDEGFITDDDRNNAAAFHAHPREGCAVFLDSIKAWRPDDADYERETLFTTVHEMGHIFNLQHTDEACWLAESQRAAPYGDDHHKFTDRQKRALAACSRAAEVMPGGSRFGETGDYGATNLIRPGRYGLDGLKLKTSVGARGFWAFEPVELDIEVSVAPDAPQAFEIPDRIDPGYECFKIWIEEPTGERRLYRSPRRYCSRPATKALAPGQAFRRDVSLFRQAGGLTFRRAGLHRVWAEFEARPGEWLQSEPVEFEILGAADGWLYQRARSVLERTACSRLLYHRALRRGLRAEPLEALVAETGDWEGAGRIRYGLGRALLHASIGRPKDQAHHYRQRAREHLNRALDGEGLGATQRRWAEVLVEEGHQAAPPHVSF